MIKQNIDNDIKSAMLDGDKKLVTTLRTLKSVILNEEVNQGLRDKGLEENVVMLLLQKELKKRNEASEMYLKAGDQERANNEKYEVSIIQKYLPEMLSTDEVLKLIEEAMKDIEDPSMKSMGQIIGNVKQKAGPKVDGSELANLVTQKLDKKI